MGSTVLRKMSTFLDVSIHPIQRYLILFGIPGNVENCLLNRHSSLQVLKNNVKVLLSISKVKHSPKLYINYIVIAKHHPEKHAYSTFTQTASFKGIWQSANLSDCNGHYYNGNKI